MILIINELVWLWISGDYLIFKWVFINGWFVECLICYFRLLVVYC